MLFRTFFEAYVYVKSSIVYDALFAIIAGVIITTLVFKLLGIVKDMVSEGKGFHARHFFELGKEYMFVMIIVVMLPVFVTLFEQLLAYTADQLVNNLAPGGAIITMNTSCIWQNAWWKSARTWTWRMP